MKLAVVVVVVAVGTVVFAGLSLIADVVAFVADLESHSVEELVVVVELVALVVEHGIGAEKGVVVDD